MRGGLVMTSKDSPRFPTIHLTSLIIHHLDPMVNTILLPKIR